MPKKSKSLTVRGEIEILHPVEPVPNLKAALERMVEQKIAEMMGDNQDGIFEPFFQAPAIAAAIRKLETVPQQRKWQRYFEEWGCMICAKQRRWVISTLGMCAACFHRTRMRLQRILRAGGSRQARADASSRPAECGAGSTQAGSEGAASEEEEMTCSG